MVRTIWLCLVWLTVMPLAAHAAPWRLSDLYSDETLTYWQGRYVKNLQWNFDNLVLGKLTPKERRQVGDVRLAYPLRAPGEMRDNPIQFFAGGRTITLPILSVKFFDDITQAWGYLWSNGYDLQLVADYLAMIKYRNPADLPGGKFPPPLAALGIADDAWKHDKKMDDVSQKALKSALVWIMAHELGHIYHRHPGYGPQVSRQQAQRNEAEADRFANMIMRRVGVAPMGMVHFFMTMAQLDAGRGDFASDAAWERYMQTKATHPLTASRLGAIALDLRNDPEDFTSEQPDRAAAVRSIYYIADQIAGIGAILEDPQMHLLTVWIGLATDLPSLRHHQRVLPSAEPGHLCVSDGSSTPFSGAFTGLYARYLKNGQKEWLNARLDLRRNGNRVAGRFSFGLGEGTIAGSVVQGQQMVYDWQWGTMGGRGALIPTPSGGLAGDWGHDQSVQGGGGWELCPAVGE